MSGTVRAAEQAAEAFPTGSEVYDLRTVTTTLSLGAERLRARLEKGLQARGGARLHRVLHRRSAAARPRRDAGVPAPGRPYRAGGIFVGGVFDIKPLIHGVDGTLQATPRSAARRRRCRAWSATSRSAAHPATSSTSHDRRRQRGGAAAHPRADRAAASRRPLRLPGARGRRRRDAHRPGHLRVCYDRGVTEPALPLRFGGGRYHERPPLPRLSFDPSSLIMSSRRARPASRRRGPAPRGVRPGDGGDLIEHFPRRYEDFRDRKQIRDLKVGRRRRCAPWWSE